MSNCSHVDKCEFCHEEMRKLKVEAAVRGGLVRSLKEKLGVDGLTGTPQLEAALKRVEQLLLIERIAIAAEKEGLRSALLEDVAN